MCDMIMLLSKDGLADRKKRLDSTTKSKDAKFRHEAPKAHKKTLQCFTRESNRSSGGGDIVWPW